MDKLIAAFVDSRERFVAKYGEESFEEVCALLEAHFLTLDPWLGREKTERPGFHYAYAVEVWDLLNGLRTANVDSPSVVLGLIVETLSKGATVYRKAGQEYRTYPGSAHAEVAERVYAALDADAPSARQRREHPSAAPVEGRDGEGGGDVSG